MVTMNNEELFEVLNKEAQFTCEMLCFGVTQIRKANYARKGLYFQAFFNLSTGLERIGKLCLILNFIRKNGSFPDGSFLKFLKKDIGHNIEKIYNELLKIKEECQCNLKFLNDLNSDIYQTISKILSQFAKGDRYSNIDLVTDKRTNDPIEMWFKHVDLYFFEKCISEKKKRRIKNNARIVSSFLEPITFVRYRSEDKKDIVSVEEASFRTGVWKAVAPYRQLYTFQIIRFFVEIINCLQYKIIENAKFEIPYFDEIFGIFYNDDSYVKRRRTWE
ncbi:MAG: hypothetical protein DRJ36_02745 [Thermoprotei archaeon]|nr:MAG: hypothetical protein DRJ36_02745 [Thermoprotei archaeon]